MTVNIQQRKLLSQLSAVFLQARTTHSLTQRLWTSPATTDLESKKSDYEEKRNSTRSSFPSSSKIQRTFYCSKADVGSASLGLCVPQFTGRERVLQNIPALCGSKPLVAGLQGKSPSYCVQVRHKSKKKKTAASDSDSDADSDSDEEVPLDEVDFEAGPTFKVMKTNVSSLRADGIISHALDVARNRMEELFLSSHLMVNGKKLLKKATKMNEGEYADVIVEKLEDQLKVKRVKVIKVYPTKTKKDKFVVKLRVWKAPFAVKKPDRLQDDS